MASTEALAKDCAAFAAEPAVGASGVELVELSAPGAFPPLPGGEGRGEGGRFHRKGSCYLRSEWIRFFAEVPSF